ncbi:MAG: hypothetical protein IJ571_08750 [Ruminococcus sp.]|nr:hypothetical protein [Ruminococcus sp.]
MELKNELFAVKLYELQKAYDTLLSCVEALSGKDRSKLAKRFDTVRGELDEELRSLKRYSGYSRLPLVSMLSKVQLDYYEKFGEIAEEDADNYEMDNAEKTALCAEYLIDSAVYSVRQAMAAALRAALMQDENK